MKLKSKLLIAILFLFVSFLLLMSCSDNSSSPDIDPEPDPDEFIINPDSKPLDEYNWQNHLQEIDSTDFTLTFGNSFDESKGWEDGDILISNEGNGLLREIVEIEKGNNLITVKTKQASLTDYIEQGKIEIRVPLEVEDIQEPEKIEYTLEGSRILFGADAMEQHKLYKQHQKGIPWKFDSKLNKDFFENFESEFASGVSISGEYLLVTDLILEMDIKLRKQPLRYFELSYEIENDFSLAFKAESKATFEGTIKLTKKPIKFAPVVIPTPIGAPITINPSLEVYVGVNGEVFGALESDASYKNSLKIGSKYEQSIGWEGINERPEPEFEVNPPYISLGGSASANITPKFNLYAYNILGGYATAEVYSLLEAGLDRDPWWELFLGLRAGLGVGAEIWGKELLDLSRDDMIDKRWSVAKAESNVMPTVTTVSVGQITKESATVVGEVERSNGASPITGRGVCWSVQDNPTLEDECEENGEGVGDFSVDITNLSTNTEYYAVAYGTNSAGTEYGDAINFSTNKEANVPPTIEITGGPSNGKTINYSNPKFEWSSNDEDGNVEEYRVELNGPDTEEFTINDSEYRFEDLQNGNYTFRVRAIDNEGSRSGWASREFTLDAESGTEDCGTVQDVDGNTYDTVKIGDQCWMEENLKTTKYRDGSSIQNVKDGEKWENLSTGAWVYYNNDSSHKNIYGKLYNWHSVDDNRGLCPIGWSVPSDEDWYELENYLGNNAGGKLKDKGTQYWKEPNTGATNDTGFSALPGGGRFESGEFSSKNSFGFWWTASEQNSNLAWFRVLDYDDTDIRRNDYPKQRGFSIRCLKN